MIKHWVWVVAAASVLGCGGGSSSSSSGESTTSGQEVAGENDGFDNAGFESSEPTVDHGTQSARALLGVHAPPQPWHSMSHEDQENWMASNVLPIAAEDFRGYDAERFTQFTCESCHGASGRANHYEMPTAELPRLPAPGSPDWQRMQAGPAWAFMHDVVTPTTAALIGEQPYDPATNSGFGCFECHMQRQ